MKKIKDLLFSSIPFFLAIGIQFIAVYYLLFIAAVFLFGVAPGSTGVHYDMNDLMMVASDMDFNTIASIIFSVSCTAVFSIWYYRSCGGNFKVNIRNTFHPLEFVGIALLVPGTQFLSSIVTGILSTIFPSWLEDYIELMETAGLSDDISWLMMIYSVLLAPISEELIFRGVTYRLARRAFPFWVANIIQAALFGAFHMNLLQGCYTFVLGLFLGYICEKGGSIYHVIFFHFMFNLWGTTASQWLVVEDEMLYGLMVLLVTIICVPLGLLVFKKGNMKKRNGIAA